MMQRAIGHIQSTTYRINCHFWRKSTEKYLWCWLKMDLTVAPQDLRMVAFVRQHRQLGISFLCYAMSFFNLNKAQTQKVRIMQRYICKRLQNKRLALIIQSASPRKAKRVRTGKTYSDSRFALHHFLPTATNNATKIAFQTKTQLVVHYVSHFLGVSNYGII